MKLIYCPQTRRQFLVGSGKTLLALPLLPSLLPRQARAQAAQSPKRLMIFHYDHNNLMGMWPQVQVANVPVGNSGAMERPLADLGTVASHSPALSHTRFEQLKNAGLLTYVRGLDIEHGAGHGNGYIAAGQDREGDWPTLDTVLEVCPSVYPANTPVNVRRAIRIAPHHGAHFFRKVGATVSSVPHYEQFSLQQFYVDTFGSLTNGTAPPQDFSNQVKTNILNQVLESFNSFRNGSKIGADDRARLDQHMDYLSDLQRSYASSGAPAITCNRPSDPGNVSGNDHVTYNRLYMDLMAVAFRCGITKVGVFSFEGHDPQWIPTLNTGGRGVHAVMHGEGGGALQQAVKVAWWRYFADMIADRFIAPLQEMEGDTGRSYIENMVTVLACQGGWADPGNDGGHNGLDSQQILIGNMGGVMRSGMYLANPRTNFPTDFSDIYNGPTIPMNRFLITLLQLMGAQPSEYAFATPNGQGFGYYGAFNSSYPRRNQFYQPIAELLA